MGLQSCDTKAVPLCRQHHGEWGVRQRIGDWSNDETKARFEAEAQRMVQLSRRAGILPPALEAA